MYKTMNNPVAVTTLVRYNTETTYTDGYNLSLHLSKPIVTFIF